MRILSITLLALTFAGARWFHYHLDMPPAQAGLLTVWSLAAYAVLVPLAMKRARTFPYLLTAAAFDGLLLLSAVVSRFPSEPAFTASNYLPALQLLLIVPGVYFVRSTTPRPRWFLAAFGLYAAVGAVLVHLSSSIFAPPSLRTLISTVTLVVVLAGILMALAGVIAIAVRRA